VATNWAGDLRPQLSRLICPEHRAAAEPDADPEPSVSTSLPLDERRLQWVESSEDEGWVAPDSAARSWCAASSRRSRSPP
jgi:hypothetical protein